jgi:hypothetical protein
MVWGATVHNATTTGASLVSTVHLESTVENRGAPKAFFIIIIHFFLWLRTMEHALLVSNDFQDLY